MIKDRSYHGNPKTTQQGLETKETNKNVNVLGLVNYTIMKRHVNLQLSNMQPFSLDPNCKLLLNSTELYEKLYLLGKIVFFDKVCLSDFSVFNNY